MKIIVLALICIFFTAINLDAQSVNLESEVNAFRADHVKQMVDYKKPPITEDRVGELKYFPISEKWIIDAEIIQMETPKLFPMKTSNGKTKYFSASAKARFEMEGKSLELFLFQRCSALGKVIDPSRYFVPFTDKTTGVESYGGGRYMDIDAHQVINKSLKINFNMAYNPWCAYGGLYSCPIPPKENDLAIKVESGEMNAH